MKTIVVIGLGNLGERHLQSLLIYRDEYKICGVEPNANRADELTSKYPDAHIFNNIECIPDEIDLGIIATSSGPRRAVFDELILHSEVKNILFEKILFQNVKDYIYVDEILKTKGIKAWVNCARREWNSYKCLKNTFLK